MKFSMNFPRRDLIAVWMGAGLLCMWLIPQDKTAARRPGDQRPGNQEEAGYLAGKVVSISDGDTLTLLDRNRKTWRIRLAGIDAPERGQPFGESARQSLAELVFGQEVTADCPEQDRYGRLVCIIRLGSRDINHEQVRRGMAWVFRRYTNRPDYIQSEEKARRERTGLWKDPRPIPPWEWRQAKNGKAKTGTSEP